MSYYTFVFGPAGSGKSTFVKNLVIHASMVGRELIPVNLDPSVKTEYGIDISNLAPTNAVMEAEGLGPNGALLFALSEVLEETDFGDEDGYYIFDCPGQIELFMSSNIFTTFIKKLDGPKCILYITDSNFHDLVGSAVCAMICTVRFNLPTINIISKVDLLDDGKLKEIMEMNWLYEEGGSDFKKVLKDLITAHGYTNFSPVEWNNEELIGNILYEMDTVLQFYDDCEPKETIK